MVEKQHRQWTQEMRKANLMTVAEMMQKEGGFSIIMLSDSMPDFEKYVSLEIGCTIKQAKDYIATLRGAMIFKQKSMAREEELKRGKTQE